MSRPKDSELIADIMWWLRGYMSGKLTPDYFTVEHLVALTDAKIYAEKKENEG